ncbi:MAG: hybrid sensor histidine kinase/response regulator [Thermodesulfobacteriota bacterium]
MKKQNAILKENLRLREEVERITRHDLKTPLNAVLSVPKLLIEEGGLSENQVEMLQMVEESGYRMLEIINNSLDLYKMETGAYKYNPVPVDLLGLVRQIHGETRGIMQGKGLKLALWLNSKKADEDSKFLVAGEEMLCYSMLANLIKNAVEASPANEVITIRLDDTKVPMVAIHNQGVVPEEIRNRFFEKYVTSGKKDGTGLGTYSAALIAKTLGGNIAFVTAEEAGTTIFLKFLKVTEVSAPPQAAPEPTQRPAAAAVPTVPKKPARILVADDYSNMRRTIIGILQQMGFSTFREAWDGLRAKQILDSDTVDLVISDWNMPEMTGMELLSYVRSSDRLKHIPFIIISGEAQQDNIIEAGRRKVSGYIIKPFSADVLKKTVEKHLSPGE